MGNLDQDCEIYTYPDFQNMFWLVLQHLFIKCKRYV